MTYWHYTYMIVNGNAINHGWGILQQNQKDFNFLRIYIDNPNEVILSVTQISEEQFNELEKLIDNEKEKEL